MDLGSFKRKAPRTMRESGDSLKRLGLSADGQPDIVSRPTPPAKRLAKQPKRRQEQWTEEEDPEEQILAGYYRRQQPTPEPEEREREIFSTRPPTDYARNDTRRTGERTGEREAALERLAQATGKAARKADAQDPRPGPRAKALLEEAIELWNSLCTIPAMKIRKPAERAEQEAVSWDRFTKRAQELTESIALRRAETGVYENQGRSSLISDIFAFRIDGLSGGDESRWIAELFVAFADILAEERGIPTGPDQPITFTYAEDPDQRPYVVVFCEDGFRSLGVVLGWSCWAEAGLLIRDKTLAVRQIPRLRSIATTQTGFPEGIDLDSDFLAKAGVGVDRDAVRDLIGLLRTGQTPPLEDWFDHFEETYGVPNPWLS